jgi:hypothetical protein
MTAKAYGEVQIDAEATVEQLPTDAVESIREYARRLEREFLDAIHTTEDGETRRGDAARGMNRDDGIVRLYAVVDVEDLDAEETQRVATVARDTERAFAEAVAETRDAVGGSCS